MRVSIEGRQLRLAFVFQAEHRTMTAFILAVIVNSYNTGQVSTPATPSPQSPPLTLQRSWAHWETWCHVGARACPAEARALRLASHLQGEYESGIYNEEN